MLNIPPCQSVNNSGWVEVAAKLSITLYILLHTKIIYYIPSHL